MFKKEFDEFSDIINIDNFERICMEQYPYYIDTVIDFKEKKSDVYLIVKEYGQNIINEIFRNDNLRDRVLSDSDKKIRHDKEIKDEIDVQKVISKIFEKGDGLNYFEKRMRAIIILEATKLINCYGMETLNKNREKILKEIRLGIFEAKMNMFVSTMELQKIKKRVEIDEIWGEEAIPYIENYKLLKNRVKDLRDFSNVQSEIEKLDEIIKKINLIDEMLEKRDKNLLNLLKEVYDSYEKINREMIISRINNRNGNLLLLHFIPEFNDDTDYIKEDFFEKEIDEWIKSRIKIKYGREFDHKKDEDEWRKLYIKYQNSRDNLFDLSLRIPLKNRYSNSSYKTIITKPTTNLSCSIGKIGTLSPHLKRKIAIGFTDIPVDSIKSINSGYNNELDKFSFERNSASLVEILRYIEKGGVNETLIDWTKIQPSYIMIIKNERELPKNLLEKVQNHNQTLNLPIQIYDAYEMEKKRNKNKLNSEYSEIEGAYSLYDLTSFVSSETKTSENIFLKIKNMIKDKVQDLGGNSKWI